MIFFAACFVRVHFSSQPAGEIILRASPKMEAERGSCRACSACEAKRALALRSSATVVERALYTVRAAVADSIAAALMHSARFERDRR